MFHAFELPAAPQQHSDTEHRIVAVEQMRSDTTLLYEVRIVEFATQRYEKACTVVCEPESFLRPGSYRVRVNWSAWGQQDSDSTLLFMRALAYGTEIAGAMERHVARTSKG